MIELKIDKEEIEIESHGAIGDIADDVVQGTLALAGMVENYHADVGRIVREKIIIELLNGTRPEVAEMTTKETAEEVEQ